MRRPSGAVAAGAAAGRGDPGQAAGSARGAAAAGAAETEAAVPAATEQPFWRLRSGWRAGLGAAD
uniref:Uncharacterized protein n=1 Tax=Macrostomum lignano TaxID=282301 RepID=A0A1I8HBA0_9PLAT